MRMNTTDAKCHMEIKRRIVIGEETFSKKKEHLRGKLDRNQKKERTPESKTRQESEETDDENHCYEVSCCKDHRHGLREKEAIKRLEALEM